MYNKNDKPNKFYVLVSSGMEVLNLVDKMVTHGKKSGYDSELAATEAVKEYLNIHPDEWGVISTIIRSFTSKVVVDDVTYPKDQK